MIAIGVDAHKRVHAALARDDAGAVLSSWRGPNTAKGWMELWHWANQWSQPRHWGIEGAWNYGRGLAQFLVAHHEVVFERGPRWTAERRRRTRKADMSDADREPNENYATMSSRSRELRRTPDGAVSPSKS